MCYLHNKDMQHLSRVMKLIRSVEPTDPKSLAAIAKVEIDDNLMSYFEAMAACVLPHGLVANNKASAKSDRHGVSQLNDSSMVRSRTRQDLDLRCYDRKECSNLSIQDKKTLRDWRASNLKEFGQSRKRVLNALNENKNKRHKRNNHSKNSEMSTHA